MAETVNDPWTPDDIKSGDYQKVDYFNMKDGEKVQFRLLTSPYRVWLHRIEVGKVGHPATCPGVDDCPAHEAGQKAKRVMACIVLDRRDGKVKLWEFSNTTLGKIQTVNETVKALRPDLVDPRQYDMRIDRKGVKLDTEYFLNLGDNKDQLTEDEKKLVLPNLEEYYKVNPERMKSLLSGVVPAKKKPVETPNNDAGVAAGAMVPATNPIANDDSDVV